MKKTAVLLLQLGTPDDTSVPAVRRYLREFLGDPRIIEVNRFLWWFILNGVVLPFRPSRSAAKYRRLIDLCEKEFGWDRAKQGLPLQWFTRRQTQLLQEELGSDFFVDYGMRYGNPNLRDVVPRLARDGFEQILAVPLYPQYSATTTGSALDGLYQAAMKLRYVPAITVVPPYYEHPAFLDAMETLLREELAQLDDPPEHFLLTYHGIPQKYAQRGDPYPRHVERTTQALVRRLGWRKGSWSRTYQSIFGRDPWLKPYTEERLVALAKQGCKSVFVATAGFTADCLETVDEIGFEAREVFEQAGGEHLHRAPCLNEHPAWIRCLRILVEEHVAVKSRQKPDPALDCVHC